MSKVLEQLLGRGFKLPFHFVCLALNGSVLAGTYREAQGELKCEITAEHTVESVFAMPTNCIYVDADGDVARVVVDADGDVSLFQVKPDERHSN